ncbi:MAG: prepilin-type N-terminal cleavage/methylation domain-containing protein [Candidatus Omnitrophica bacterium]|nr:prepilin-type N-terminal cleavage/methylation domain-containing protein [Candidatus Omnitrophota bacterium]
MSRRRGVTLVELMVTVAVVGVVTAIGTGALISGRRGWQASENQIAIQRYARQGLQRMSKELKRASASTVVGVPADGSGHNSIQFQIAESFDSNSGNIVWSQPVRYVLGGADGEQLIRSQGGQTEILANYISSVTFARSNADPNLVAVTVQSRKTALNQRTEQINLSSEIRLRN